MYYLKKVILKYIKFVIHHFFNMEHRNNKHIQVYECDMATLKYEEGFLYFISKPVERNLQNAEELISLLDMILKGSKAYVLVDATYSKAMTKEARDYLDKQLPNYYKTVAVTSNSVLGAFVANIFVRLKPPSYKIRIFTKESEARQWLNEQMNVAA